MIKAEARLVIKLVEINSLCIKKSADISAVPKSSKKISCRKFNLDESSVL